MVSAMAMVIVLLALRRQFKPMSRGSAARHWQQVDLHAILSPGATPFRRLKRWFLFSSSSNASLASPMSSPTRSRRPRSPRRLYSTAGDYDLLVKFYVDNDTDIGHFVNEKVQVIPGIQDTHTIITFKAFGSK